MALAEIQEYLKLIPTMKQTPEHSIWLSYDAEADTLYINFKKPSGSFRQNDDMKLRLFPPCVVATPRRTTSATAGLRLAWQKNPSVSLCNCFGGTNH